jgi:hypothetical protein
MGPFLRAAVETLLVVHGAGATLTGTVRDSETEAPIAGAVVALADLGRAVASDADGRYTIRPVPEGLHRLEIHFVGYAPCTLQALAPPEGQLEIHVRLHAEPFRLPPVDVRASVAVRGLDGGPAAWPDRESSIAAVRNHPLLAEPDVFQALGGGEVVLMPESPSGIHIRGGASDQTAYVVDGIPVLSPYHAAGLSSGWNPDALSRVSLSASVPSPDSPHALSGTVAAVTRSPGRQLHARGSVSTTQARFALDGPLGVAGAGYVVGWRSGLPDVIAPKDESSYVRGETGDFLAKLEAPAFGGRLALLGYSSEDDLGTAALVPTEGGASPDVPRHAFEWTAGSWGGSWARDYSSAAVRVLAWSAACGASARWARAVAPLEMTAARRDEGLLATAEHHSVRAVTVVGIRAERIRTSYRTVADSAAAPSWELEATTPVATLLAQQTRAVAPGVQVGLGVALAAAPGGIHPEPRGQLVWNASKTVTATGGYARTHQFAQSLRNPESVVGNVFPVELHVGAGAAGVPVAQSDQGMVGVDFKPAAGARLGAHAYARSSDGLLLVAPREDGPFANGEFVNGSGTARGFSIEAAASSARWGVLASYGYQQVRLEYGGSSYVPESAAGHVLEGGVISFPVTGVSIRLGATYAEGRHATAVTNGFEWEAHNLLDRGSEFAGSPEAGGAPLAAASLPAYFRVDLSLRKQWRFVAAGREATIALFGTVTNLLGWKNVLTYTRDPALGEAAEVEMRPRAPLVLGLDWQF